MKIIKIYCATKYALSILYTQTYTVPRIMTLATLYNAGRLPRGDVEIVSSSLELEPNICKETMKNNQCIFL